MHTVLFFIVCFAPDSLINFFNLRWLFDRKHFCRKVDKNVILISSFVFIFTWVLIFAFYFIGIFVRALSVTTNREDDANYEFKPISFYVLREMTVIVDYSFMTTLHEDFFASKFESNVICFILNLILVS